MSGTFRWRVFVVVIGVVVLSVLAQHAEAQRRGRGGMRPGNVTPTRLLIIEAVQTDLKMTDVQKAKAAEINQALTSGRQKLFAEVTKESGKRGPKVAQLNKKATADIDALLDEAQRKRLQEVMLQVNGASELTKKQILEALDITPDQKKKLSAVRRENAKARRDALADYEGDRMAKMVELQKAADQKLLEVLTDEQRKKYQEMQGARLKIDVFAS